jgi:hypothetical protein
MGGKLAEDPRQPWPRQQETRRGVPSALLAQTDASRDPQRAVRHTSYVGVLASDRAVDNLVGGEL